ncbi:XRE family transcriptional regulator [Bifidobacterium cuniculi]|uniref:XRE family transcriptional regulator n=2 Tax=Bifidobacterium cuniculi TaxID=1688 RepID=A0A087B4B4_9BIFI|nr:XRE family transcriptional regulator [Bifidobacterium cuniculi]
MGMTTRPDDVREDFGTRLRALRKQAGLSQKQLAHRIYVTRQAVAKWENGAGRPDIANLTALAAVFGVTLDRLMGLAAQDGTADTGGGDLRYENVTAYDIDGPKHFDIDCGSVYSCTIGGYEGEQLRVRVASNTVEQLAQHVKVSLDDRPKRIDVAVNRGSGISESLAKDDICVRLWIPQRHLASLECAAKAQTVQVRHLECERLELDLKAPNLRLEEVSGHVEVDCNLDMDIDCATLDGQLDINQVSATSRIAIPTGVPVALTTRGVRTRMIVGAGVRQDEDAADGIELNGIASELIVETRTAPSSMSRSSDTMKTHG